MKISAKKLLCFFLAGIAFDATATDLPFFSVNTLLNSQNPWSADVWWPLSQINQNYFFAELDGAYSPNQYSRNIETGGVYRQKTANDWAWGGYTYAAYNRSSLGQRFWTLNPGIEFLNAQWHLNWNAYLPLSPTSQASGPWQWADDVGIYNYVEFQGHQQYDQLVQATSRTGVGTDVIAGYRFASLDNLQLSLGSYYFNMPHHPLGFAATVATPTWNHVNYNLSFLHDPLTHNSVNVGISVHFGGSKTASQDWMNEPVQHDLAGLGQANSIPITTGYQSQGKELLEKDNIWFFSPNAPFYDPSKGLQNCTYEHPCYGLDNTTTQSIAAVAPTGNFEDAPSLYLAPGIYDESGINLYGNESLIGRNANYTQPAEGDDRPILWTNEITIDGNNNNQSNTLANLQMANHGDAVPAIYIENAQNVSLDNMQIGTFDPDVPAYNYITGVYIQNSQNVNIDNSIITANNFLTGNTYQVLGIAAENVQNLLIQNSTINAIAVGDNNRGATGLTLLSGTNNVTIDHSFFTQEAEGLNSLVQNIYSDPSANTNLNINQSTLNANIKSDNGIINNITLGGNSTATISNSTLNLDASATHDVQGAVGIVLYNNAALTLNNSSMTSTAESTAGKAAATNFYLYNNAIANINSSNLFASGNAADVTGSTNITTTNASTANVSNSILEADMAGGPSTGEPSGADSIWSLNNSTVNINNSTVIAKSNNDTTSAVTIQAQDQSHVSVNNSTLTAYQQHGNITGVETLNVAGLGDAIINITNSNLEEYAAGNTNADASLIIGIGNSLINISNSLLLVNNQMEGSGSIKTIGATAQDSSIINLTNDTFSLTGAETQISSTSGGGQVIINNGFPLSWQGYPSVIASEAWRSRF